MNSRWHGRTDRLDNNPVDQKRPVDRAQTLRRGSNVGKKLDEPIVRKRVTFVTFWSLLFWLTAGYIFGLLFASVLKRRKLIFDICAECGIAGGIGAAIPNVLLQSVWVQQMAASTSESAWYNLILFLNKHIPVVNVLTSLTAIAIASAFGSTANPEPSHQSNEKDV